MPSIFYDEYFRQNIPLTSLLVEWVSEQMQTLPIDARDEAFAKIIADGLVVCGLVEGTPTQEQVISVAKGLGEMAEESAGKGKGGTESHAGKFFAGYLTEWASSLTPTGLSLYAAEYDLELAKTYFYELDQRFLVAIAHEKLSLEYEKARVGFEASLFGFGGKYKGTPSSDDADAGFDLSKDNAAAEVALKNLGF